METSDTEFFEVEKILNALVEIKITKEANPVEMCLKSNKTHSGKKRLKEYYKNLNLDCEKVQQTYYDDTIEFYADKIATYSDYKEGKIGWYNVKWKNYSKEYNSWEPFSEDSAFAKGGSSYWMVQKYWSEMQAELGENFTSSEGEGEEGEEAEEEQEEAADEEDESRGRADGGRSPENSCSEIVTVRVETETHDTSTESKKKRSDTFKSISLENYTNQPYFCVKKFRKKSDSWCKLTVTNLTSDKRQDKVLRLAPSDVVFTKITKSSCMESPLLYFTSTSNLTSKSNFLCPLNASSTSQNFQKFFLQQITEYCEKLT